MQKWLVFPCVVLALAAFLGCDDIAKGFGNASGVTSKPANGGHFKTGQRKWPGTKLFYSDASCGGKSVFVRQLRGPHLSTWP